MDKQGETMTKAMRPVLASVLALLAATAVPQPGSADDAPKTFRMIAGEPRFMDPNLASDFAIFVNAQLFQPLARLNKDGSLSMLQAKSIELAPDGRTWTITLNPDYKWSNGEPITAADYEYSWKRILDPKMASEVAVFLGDVENADDYNKGKITDPAKVGIKATGDYTLQVVTAGPAPQFRAKLALPYLTAVPKAVVEKYGDKWILPGNMVSNGPYKLVSRVNDQSIGMEANPYYGGKKPAIPRVQVTIASGDICAAQLRAYEADEIDFVTCLPSQDIARVLSDATLKKQLDPFPLAATEWIQYDMSRAPWTDKRVRQALALAIDKKQIVTAVSNDTAHVAATLVPDSIPGGNSGDALQGTVADAQKLLADAGFPGGKGFPAFTITTAGILGRPLVAQMVQQMWADNLGIQGTINVMESNAFRAWVAARKTEPYDIMIQGWWSDYADPANWYGDLIINDFRKSHFKNDAFAALVAKGNAEPDPAKRLQIFREANKLLEEEQPMTAYDNPTDLWLVKPNVRNLRHEGVLDMYHIEEASFE
jgi:oligopeptide transport system substrate-binding protein